MGKTNEKPAEVSQLARETDGSPKDWLPRHLKRLGWTKTKEIPSSGAWWVTKGDIEVLITFGGPLKDSAVFQWRRKGGPSHSM